MKIFSLKYAASMAAVILAANGLAYVSAARAEDKPVGKAEYCTGWGNLAHSIAVGRDVGVPIADMLAQAKGDKDIEALVVLTYDNPGVSPKDAAQIVIIACMKAE